MKQALKPVFVFFFNRMVAPVALIDVCESSLLLKVCGA